MQTTAKPESLLHEDWFDADPPAVLKRLLPVAVRALYAEDRRLALALASSSRRNPAWNYGLAYWVFETTLVYEMFKALLPVTAIEWESRYPDRVAQADLVVFEEDRASLVFEAKWWMSNQKKVLSLLKADAEKMLSWNDIDGRYLLTFWHSPNSPTAWERDIADVRGFCRQYQGACLAPVYAAAFPTDVAATRQGDGSLFAVCALSVMPE